MSSMSLVFTPGAASGSGGIVASGTKTSDTSITATTEGTANTIVTASAFTADGSSSYLITFFTPLVTLAGTSNSTKFWLYLDGSSVGQLGVINVASNVLAPCTLHAYVTPASGSRTYSIRASVDSGTTTISGGAGGSGVLNASLITVSH